MDFSKINGELKPNEEASKVIKKEKPSISFSDVLKDRKTYTLPSLGETSVSSGSDQATISESAKTAYYLLKIKSMVASIQDIRERKIENAIKLLNDGIDNPKVTKEIAKRLVDILK